MILHESPSGRCLLAINLNFWGQTTISVTTTALPACAVAPVCPVSHAGPVSRQSHRQSGRCPRKNCHCSPGESGQQGSGPARTGTDHGKPLACSLRSLPDQDKSHAGSTARFLLPKRWPDSSTSDTRQDAPPSRLTPGSARYSADSGESGQLCR